MNSKCPDLGPWEWFLKYWEWCGTNAEQQKLEREGKKAVEAFELIPGAPILLQIKMAEPEAMQFQTR